MDALPLASLRATLEDEKKTTDGSAAEKIQCYQIVNFRFGNNTRFATKSEIYDLVTLNFFNGQRRMPDFTRGIP